MIILDKDVLNEEKILKDFDGRIITDSIYDAIAESEAVLVMENNGLSGNRETFDTIWHSVLFVDGSEMDIYEKLA